MSLPLRLDAPSPLEYFASLVAEDEHFALLEAAVSLGQDADPSLDPQAVIDEIEALGDRLRRRLPADASAMHRLRTLNRYFFRELGFAGNVNDYYDAANSYLHQVLASRRGIPISLALLYIELAGHAGLTARGVSFPGHFLVKLRLPHGEAVMDPFNGRSLSREELEERLEPLRRKQGLVGDFEVPLGLFLQSATPRDILARMLRNLKSIHQQAEDFTSLLSVQHRLVCLLPDAWDERRDRGLTLAELGQPDAAADDLVAYLAHEPDAADAEPMRRMLAELRDSPRPLLH
ncbi:SirB1 family protein [Ideonella sp.]|uniref:SirB1 family protein n=1 Tax=Ideonella sp. TaxID=1929293 RepID=UPI002B498622|nr:tetratricopeptide repeat protein [Ideonella sp.]HJV67607.1 tetratricopeptide repeat protein [Ideonella sp.]